MNKCLNCQKETLNNKFCSRSCSASYFNRTQPKRKCTRKCIKCENTVMSYKHSRCEKHHKEYMETRYSSFRELTLNDYWNKKSLQNLHASCKNNHIRSLGRSTFKNLLSKPCAKCGYNKHVELCHIKPITEFSGTDKIKDVNSLANVIQLCPNCHWEFDNNIISIDEIRIVTPTGYDPVSLS